MSHRSLDINNTWHGIVDHHTVGHRDKPELFLSRLFLNVLLLTGRPNVYTKLWETKKTKNKLIKYLPWCNLWPCTLGVVCLLLSEFSFSLMLNFNKNIPVLIWSVLMLDYMNKSEALSPCVCNCVWVYSCWKFSEMFLEMYYLLEKKQSGGKQITCWADWAIAPNHQRVSRLQVHSVMFFLLVFFLYCIIT